MLCEECRDELSSPIKIMPEQIQLHSAQPTMSALAMCRRSMSAIMSSAIWW